MLNLLFEKTSQPNNGKDSKLRLGKLSKNIKFAKYSRFVPNICDIKDEIHSRGRLVQWKSIRFVKVFIKGLLFEPALCQDFLCGINFH